MGELSSNVENFAVTLRFQLGDLVPLKRKGRPAIGGLFFQGRIVPTEAKPSELSGRNLMVDGGGCQANFLEQIPYKSTAYKNCSQIGNVTVGGAIFH